MDVWLGDRARARVRATVRARVRARIRVRVRARRLGLGAAAAHRREPAGGGVNAWREPVPEDGLGGRQKEVDGLDAEGLFVVAAAAALACDE